MDEGMYTGDTWQAKVDDTLRTFDTIVKTPGKIDADQLATWRTNLINLFEHVPLAEGTAPFRAPVAAGGRTTH